MDSKTITKYKKLFSYYYNSNVIGYFNIDLSENKVYYNSEYKYKYFIYPDNIDNDTLCKIVKTFVYTIYYKSLFNKLYEKKYNKACKDFEKYKKLYNLKTGFNLK